MKQQLSELLRPAEFADLIQPVEIIQRLEEMAQTRSMVNMLFYGRPGLGKTSAARLLLRELHVHVYEINGSVATGIDTVRKDLEMFCGTMSIFGKAKVCFIDESDFLSANAQAGLRGLIERQSQVRFLLTANQERKLTPALRSRCLPVCFDISPIDAKETVERLLPRYMRKLGALGYNVDRKHLSELMFTYFPDLRFVANQLEFEFGAPPHSAALDAFQMEQSTASE